MSMVAHKPLTAEELWALPEGEGKRELVQGEVVEWMPVGGVHADVVMELGMRLRQWSKQGRQGFVGSEAGFILQHNPDTVRAADVSFVRQDRIPEGGILEKFWALAPDLAVEVVSPSETAQEIWEKVNDYLAAGTPLVWVIYPRTQQVAVYTSDGVAHTLNRPDSLGHLEILPGFSCTVGDLFAEQNT